MAPFEYIIVLISIILGMGITEILSGIGAIISRWEKIKLYWPHSVLVLLVFIFHFQEWWVIFELRNYPSWRLPVFLFTTLYPVNLYILAKILFPIKWSNKGTDLKLFYYEHCRRIFMFIFSLAILSIIDNLFLHGIPFSNQIPQIMLALICSVIIFSRSKREWLHHVVIALLFVATVVTFIVEWDMFLLRE
jgi:hypothetical protein